MYTTGVRVMWLEFGGEEKSNFNWSLGVIE